MESSSVPSLKMPSAFLPVAMSGAALALVLGFLARYGVVHQPDEGAAAHVFQLLMVLQVPVVGFFAVKWVPRAPKKALGILAVQVAAGVAAVGTVIFLEL